jgi:hypothetical protein
MGAVHRLDVGRSVRMQRVKGLRYSRAPTERWPVGGRGASLGESTGALRILLAAQRRQGSPPTWQASDAGIAAFDFDFQYEYKL